MNTHMWGESIFENHPGISNFPKHIQAQADTIIDMATLTNGMLYIGGKHHAAIMSNLEDVENEVRSVFF